MRPIHIDFRFRSASAPLLWILLATSLPAEAAIEGTAVFCGPPRIASIGGAIPEGAIAPGEDRIIAPVAMGHNRNSAVKQPNVGKCISCPRRGILSVNCPTSQSCTAAGGRNCSK
ncbi:exported hypothetical protein [Mesorhizobium prunaredense]|uniref:Uncharacterized protein n=1 Tax=Mesorhizobium prunaredense TaxID=1631249 RepID=A0A1R3V7U2_9HYPH|nr:exported hypothetical protein [Mesorhizobium prunaredense]